ncbi:MAG: hypothetical protein JSS66_06895 [Armatimonadetes bacterium]|nr:hypothetical protein [Armatimonadota bacterium]
MPFKVVLEHDPFEEFDDVGFSWREGETRTLAEGLTTYAAAVKVLVDFDPDDELRTNDGQPPSHRLYIEYTDDAQDYERGELPYMHT